MPTVVIVHAAEDTLPARALAEKLRQAKLTVTLEHPPGEELRNAVKSAAVTVALWSPRSAQQQALAEEVVFAKGKSKLIHALMQSAQAPEQFRNEKAVNLTGWRGEDDFEPWRQLAKLVTEKAGVAPLPPPAPKPPSGFFQPGRPEEAAAAAASRPQQQQRAAQPQRAQPAPRAAPAPAPARPTPRPVPAAAANEPLEPKRGGGGLIIALVVVIVIALAGGGGYWFWTQSQSAQASATAWESLDRTDPDSLRAFLAGSPGDYRDEAQAALADLEERSYEAASDADTIQALEDFLADFPQSQHALAARGRIAELNALQPALEEGVTTEALPETPTDPDLVPPGATPDASGGGPATLTPPPAEPTGPAEEPGDAPTQ